MNTSQSTPPKASLDEPWAKLMPRHPPGTAPQWLHWCWQAAKDKDHAQLGTLADLAAQQVPGFGAKDLAELVKNPSQQMHQVLALIAAAHGCVGVTPHQWPEDEAGIYARLSDQLLQEAAKLACCTTVPGDRAPWLPDRLRNAAHCQLPVLLLDRIHPNSPKGVVAELRLYRITLADAHCRLLPAPAMACTAQTKVFARSLETVRQWLLVQYAGQSTSPALLNTALVWDLSPVDQTMGLIDGDSASAAMALGAAWLLREYMQPDLRLALNVVQATDLFKTPVTAALQADGSLGPVGGVEWKNISLDTFRTVLTRPYQQCQPLHIAKKQTDSKSQLLPTGALWQPHDNLLALAQWVAKSACPLNDGQQWLCDYLLSQNTARLNDKEHGPKLKEAARPLSPVTHPLHYFLQRWAHWALAANGQVHSRFVPLQLQPETPGQQKKLAAHLDVPFKSLVELLDELKDTGVAEAYLLRGVPGTGKTWLMRHHEMALCKQGVQACCQPPTDGPAAPVVLPLYVPLADMPSDVDPMDWLRDYVRQRGQFPRFDLLHQLLNSQVSITSGGYEVQWLLDGLNELKADSAAAREQRAKRVVHELWCSLQPRLPLLLGTRLHQSYALTNTHLNRPFRVLPVNVLDWRDTDIQAYLRQRWPQTQTTTHPDPDAVWERLRTQPATLTMCRTPMLLDGLCDLIECGLETLPSDRASLFSAWLWQRLQRETQRSENSVLHDERLLTQDERNLIANTDCWQTERLRTLPRQGVLLPSLFRQAETQWRNARDKPADQRGGVAVAWDKAVPWLGEQDSDLRKRWAQAVQDLGLCEINENLNSFKFSHQLWGEYLVSQSLLWGTVKAKPFNWQPSPEDWPPAELNELAEALRPPALERQDADELRHQQQTVQATWGAVPHATWDKLLSDGLVWDGQTRRWSQALTDLYDTRGEAGANWWINTLTQNQWLHVDAAIDCARIDIQGLGGLLDNKHAFGPSPQHWSGRPDAWKILLSNILPRVFQLAAQAQLGARAEALWQQQGRLPEPLAGDLDEVLVLAIQGQDDPLPWLQWLAQRGLWHTCALGVQGVRPRFKGPQADALLNLLRRCLLLQSVDAGPDALVGVKASGCLDALDSAEPLNPQAQPDLHQLWVAQWQQAFSQYPTPCRDLRLRQQAALDLGHLGDTLRYQRSADGQALLLHPRHWVGVGTAGQHSQFRFGDEQGRDDEKPEFSHPLPFFEMAAYPVTVAEYAAFKESDGYHPAQPWWQALGAAAQQWLKSSGRTQPRHWEDIQLNNPLQPVVGITWYEAMAYVAFARPAYAAQRQDGMQLGLPTELLREAAVRGSLKQGQHRSRYPHSDEADLLAFNHLDTGLGLPSPVGIFSLGYSGLGLADAAGSVWEWCVNAYSAQHCDASSLCTPAAQNDAEAPRALAGGSCGNATVLCRVSYRIHDRPDYVNDFIGFRLCRG